ncbi:fructose-1 6-bisphosphatase class 3 [Bacteroides sp. CAG:462]|nr:fructose-1 6-bisphosphatase class 3 [Bacteroides sp. CAG:462]
MDTPKTPTVEEINRNVKYLRLLSDRFPTIAAASTESINLEAILNLPKGTEHFLSDVHGEHEAFRHVLKNASGAVKRKVNEIFGNTLRETEKKEICTLIYYPREKLELVKASEPDMHDWYLTTLHQLVRVCRTVSSKYTRSKVQKALPPEFAYIIQELLHESSDEPNKHQYFHVIISTIIETHRADQFIVALCNLIQRLVIDSLHLIGDIYDRGPGAHLIMDTLCHYHNLDIQWGNHDILWMGAAAGNECCIANVLRTSLRYANLVTLEDGYGINLLPLATFAMDTYASDPCKSFLPKIEEGDKTHNERTCRLISQMHKAISIIQFKLEAAMTRRHPEFDMDDRNLLGRINFEKGVLVYEGKEYELNDTNFPTVDPKDPYRLTKEEEEVIHKLHYSFVGSEKLKKHIHCLLTRGSMYLSINSNLLYHASVPLNEDGTLKEVLVHGKRYKGRQLLDKVDSLVRTAFSDEPLPEQQFAVDFIWYLWCGKNSPLFDKAKMATFERYFVKDKALHKEEKGAYYDLRDNEQVCDMILDEFGVTGEHRHLITGHVPVKTKKGEKPVKANGKLIVIDGGFSRAYQSETGIAGYTLVYHSRGLQLVQHEPFTSTQEAIREGKDIISSTQLVELSSQRVMVRDTDKGLELERQIHDLFLLLTAFRKGIIKEKGQ